jgi:hypothetical protein
MLSFQTTPPGSSQPRPHRLMDRVERGLFARINLASLACFRILFGAIMLWEVARYFKHDWIEHYYINPTFFFTYFGFDWIAPWPGNLMYIHFLFLGVLAVFIMLGLWYRASALLFFLGFTYVFLIDQANYLNHFYLISLLSFLMIFVPAHRMASLDALRRPDWRTSTGPAWPLWLLRFQVGVAYFFGGIAKINGDWLRGEPMRMWLTPRTDFPLVGPLFKEEAVVYLMSYGGLLLDLLIVPFLLWRKTRYVAMLFGVWFHLTNAQLFSIGIFPWFMIAAMVLFLDPAQLRPAMQRVEKWLGGRTRLFEATLKPTARTRRLVLAGLGLYVAFQVLMPFRHHLYPGNVSWTEEGHNFSWHMKLRSKYGTLKMHAVNLETGALRNINLGDYLSTRQRRKLASRPDMVVLFAHHLRDTFKEQGYPYVAIYAENEVSLNGRPKALLIDPTVDLATVERSLLPTPWILPLEAPLQLSNSTELRDDQPAVD